MANTGMPKRGALPIIALLVVGVALLAVVITIAVLLLNQSSTKTVNISTDQPPSLIMSDADAALNKVTTMRYSMEASFTNLPGAGDKPSQLTLSGEIVRPDRYTMRGTGIGETLVVGADSWQRRDPNSGWVKQANGSGLGGLIDPTTLADSSKYYTNVMRLSDATIDGVDCYHLEFDVDASKLKSASGNLDLDSATIAAEVWVGKADSLQRQMQLVIKLPTLGNINGTVLIKLSGFNDPITITPPPG